MSGIELVKVNEEPSSGPGHVRVRRCKVASYAEGLLGPVGLPKGEPTARRLCPGKRVTGILSDTRPGADDDLPWRTMNFLQDRRVMEVDAEADLNATCLIQEGACFQHLIPPTGHDPGGDDVEGRLGTGVLVCTSLESSGRTVKLSVEQCASILGRACGDLTRSKT